MMTHLEETLARDLQHLKERILDMSGLAVRALELCERALRERDRRLAYAVILRDQRIDEMEKEVDRLCLEFLIRHQPVGTQMRFVYSAIKINAGLERIGDYAESIARQILKTSDLEPYPSLAQFVELATLAIPMLLAAMRSYLQQDAALARQTMEVESKADGVRNRINAELLGMMQQQRLPLEALTPLLTIARRFERVSDQAKNICEEALYVCTGEYAKHTGAESWRILFVGESQSCLAAMAEAIGVGLGKPELHFASAGLRLHAIDPLTRDFLLAKRLVVPEAARTVQEVPELEFFQVVVTLGAVEPPAVSGLTVKAVVLHWPLEDPTRNPGTSEELHAAHERAFQALKAHIQELSDAILGDPVK